MPGAVTCAPTRGVFRGGALCHGPPFWVARIVKLHRKVSKLVACPPPPLCKFGIAFDHTKGMFCAFLLGIGLKIGGILSEDLFFALHLILSKKSD